MFSDDTMRQTPVCEPCWIIYEVLSTHTYGTLVDCALNNPKLDSHPLLLPYRENSKKIDS